MALDSRIKELLNKFADSMPALRIPGEPLASSNPMLGDIMEEALDGGTAIDQTARDAASDAQDDATQALTDAATAQSTAEDAENQAYTAGTPGDWATTAPATLKAAVDRLAAAVEGLLTNPIP